MLVFVNVKHLCSLVIFGDVTVSEIYAVIGTDIAVTAIGESGEVTDVLRLVFGDVSDTVAFTGDYLDGVLVVGVGWVGFQGGSELSEVFINVFALCDARNGELEIVTYALILWPDADMVAFVLDAEVLKFFDGCIRTTATNHYFYLWFFNWATVVIKHVEVGGMLLLSGFILLFTGVARLGQHVSFVGHFVRIEMRQPVSHQNDGYNEKK